MSGSSIGIDDQRQEKACRTAIGHFSSPDHLGSYNNDRGGQSSLRQGSFMARSEVIKFWITYTDRPVLVDSAYNSFSKTILRCGR